MRRDLRIEQCAPFLVITEKSAPEIIRPSDFRCSFIEPPKNSARRPWELQAEIIYVRVHFDVSLGCCGHRQKAAAVIACDPKELCVDHFART